MDPISMIGMAAGAIQPLVGLFKGIRERRQRRKNPPPPPKAVGRTPVDAATGQQVASGLNPVMEQGLETAPGEAPAMRTPMQGSVLLPSAPNTQLQQPMQAQNPFQKAKQNFLFQAALNGNER